VNQPTRAFTVIFDGDCRVCTRLVGVLRRWDRDHALEIIASQDPDVRARFPWISSDDLARSMQVVSSDGATRQGAAGIEQLLGVLPRGNVVSWMFRLPFARPLADRLYRWFARNRYRLGCGVHCPTE
jgi:predicted DCC family thiol-disulfide oxidoreductase YuxK